MKYIVALLAFTYLASSLAQSVRELPGQEKRRENAFNAAELLPLSDKQIQEVNASMKAYREDPAAFYNKMATEPVDYEKVNSNLSKVTDLVTENSELVRSLDFSIESNLTNKTHQRLHKVNKHLPFVNPTTFFKVDIKAKLNEDNNFEVPLKGFKATFQLGQKVGLRGLPIAWTDRAYGFVELKIDTLKATKAILVSEMVQEVLGTFCSGDLEELLKREGQEELTASQKKAVQAAKLSCEIMDKTAQSEDFEAFLNDTKDLFLELDKISQEYQQESWNELLGPAGVALAPIFRSYQNIKIETCDSFKLFKRRSQCVPSMIFESGTEFGLADIDSVNVLTENSLNFEIWANSAGYLKAFVGLSKKDAAALVYSVLKSIETGNDSDIKVMAETFGDAFETLQEIVNHSKEGTMVKPEQTKIPLL